MLNSIGGIEPLGKETRVKRIEKLLNELRWEVSVGMLEGEIDEYLSYGFIVPLSRERYNGVVRCEFRTRPDDFAYAEPSKGLTTERG